MTNSITKNLKNHQILEKLYLKTFLPDYIYKTIEKIIKSANVVVTN